MPKYSDLFAKQPAPVRGGRLSALSLDELRSYVDQVDPGPTEQINRWAKRDAGMTAGGVMTPDKALALGLGGGATPDYAGVEPTLDNAAMMTAPVPGLGDMVGLAADARAIYDNPSWANIGGAALGALPFVPAMGAIRAYHGTPHDFDKFDLSKIGTGEGAQAYGHGLYFAEAEDTARAYQKALAPGMDDGALRAAGVPDQDLRSMRQFTQSAVDPDIALRDWLSWTGKQETPDVRAAFMREWDQRNPGHMYEVNINAEPDEFLDWDRPLSEQPESVRRALLDEGGVVPDFRANPDIEEYMSPHINGEWEGVTGGEFHRILERMASDDLLPPNGPGVNLDGAGRADAAAFLSNEGVSGIRYLDQGSRAAGEGSSNYVVFDDALVEIIRKYGLAAVLGGTGAFGLMGLQGGEDGTQPPL